MPFPEVHISIHPAHYPKGNGRHAASPRLPAAPNMPMTRIDVKLEPSGMRGNRPTENRSKGPEVSWGTPRIFADSSADSELRPVPGRIAYRTRES